MLAWSLLACAEEIGRDGFEGHLREFVEVRALARLEAFGIRGELLFAVPSLLGHCPELQSCYRLLLGYSQNDFYASDSGIDKLKVMEEHGSVPESLKPRLPELCRDLRQSSQFLLDGLPDSTLDARFFEELALLAHGPQLRGGRTSNVELALTSMFSI
jgi:hypothetical protein